ncbi:helix-turn-helix domain-containing protein, partial [Francisella tularensis subsp. holarctica]|uniref:helix-turn-helix domain-containing protein n=1 Tax=Francisella tularensis TaxID=263 RepID=UPI002381C447
AALSPRTLRRDFLSVTGLSFSSWRKQAQVARGFDMLAKYISVTEFSDSFGYASTSYFRAMFRKSFGKSPKQYLSSE